MGVPLKVLLVWQDEQATDACLSVSKNADRLWSKVEGAQPEVVWQDWH